MYFCTTQFASRAWEVSKSPMILSNWFIITIPFPRERAPGLQIQRFRIPSAVIEVQYGAKRKSVFLIESYLFYWNQIVNGQRLFEVKRFCWTYPGGFRTISWVEFEFLVDDIVVLMEENFPVLIQKCWRKEPVNLKVRWEWRLIPSKFKLGSNQLEQNQN